VEPAFHRRIHDASLGQAKEKISGKKRKNRDRTKQSRRSDGEVSLDNADAIIDGCRTPAFEAVKKPNLAILPVKQNVCWGRIIRV
jgi:hypothetical protein